MTEPERLAWIEFYKLHPFDDYHRFFRPAAVLATSINGADPNDVLDWLEKRTHAQYSDAAMNSMKAHGLRPPMRK